MYSWFILIFCFLHLDSCFLENQVYGLDQNQECLKLRTPQECQLACQQTAYCSKFSYFTKNFKGVNDVKNGASREPLDCCLLTYAYLQFKFKVIKKQHVVSGPKFCPSKSAKKTLSKNNVRDVFSGKIIKYKDIMSFV